MSSSIRISSEFEMIRAVDVVGNLPVDGSMEVVVQKASNKRSDAQNRLMWKWHSLWSEYYNSHYADQSSWITKARAHDEFKWRHVRPILCAEDSQLAGLCDIAIDGGKAGVVAKFLSTTDLKVEQFTDALNEYDRRAQTKGLVFPTGDSMYHEAMGQR